MATSRFAPKVRALTSSETSASFEIWKENLVFNLTIDGNFEEFLEDNYKWQPTSVNNRGLTPDAPEANKPRTAKQKLAMLQLMLGSIASYSPVISRQSIVADALCLNDIWSRLRTHYGFRKTGALILDLPAINLNTDTSGESESYEALWERYHAFVTDNLLSETDNIKHMGLTPPTEMFSPTLLNVTIVLWLKAIHPGLPNLVKQKYATELRNHTIASLREEISESLESLVTELSSENVSVLRAYTSNTPKKFPPRQQRSSKLCVLCDANKRPSDHFLSECMFLPESDKKFIQGRRGTRMRLIEVEDDDLSDDQLVDSISLHSRRATSKSNSTDKAVQLRKVDIMKSPVIYAKFGEHTVPLTLDSGAEADLMRRSCANRIGVKIHPTKATASQADGLSDLNIVGEVHCEFNRGAHTFRFNGLVSEDLSDDIICGVPFQAVNDIYARPSTRSIYIGEEVIPYEDEAVKGKAVYRGCKAAILRVQRQTVLMPDESLSLPVPSEFSEDESVSIEPRYDAPSLNQAKYTSQWLKPHLTSLDNGTLNVTNTSDSPILIKRHEQIATIRPVTCYNKAVDQSSLPQYSPTVPEETIDYKSVAVDVSKQLTDSEREQFHNLHCAFKEVFDSRTLGCYNGKSGPLEVAINMGPTQPPQRKGKMPMYSRTLQEEQQRICDELEGTVLLRPEVAGITVEYLNPSFLVKKPSGKKRLVTAFSEVGQYTKPQPALMPDTNQVLRFIGNWKYLLKTDLSSAYWQMILEKSSMKYCGIVTPFRGVRVYARGAMGMPGTETALEELMCRILGDLLLEGNVCKIADDLYIGGESPQVVLKVWEQVLTALRDNGLRLSAAKTECCPKTATILGWLWSQGTLKATPHRVSALAAAEVPATVCQLRSYLGGYKFLSRVMKSYCDVLSPLEDMVAGRKSAEKLQWSSAALDAFKLSQQRLSNLKTLTMPQKGDHLQIVTDASQSKLGLAAALYVVRQNKPYISGYFNAKYRPHQRDWLPCELEALAIGTSVNHFAQYIVSSDHQTCVFTDSLPCVQAYQKLCQGKFSASARVSTFLSVISRYQARLLHIKGVTNQYSDYASRNLPECNQKECQICRYVNELADSVVRSCSVTEVLNSQAKVPYSSRSGWHELQCSCDSLRRTCAHLKQGTAPSKKCTKVRDVKRYLLVGKIARDGLLVVVHQGPATSKVEQIVVPRQYLHGLLECLHIKLQHPSKAQLRKVFNRAFYALDIDSAVDVVTSTCHTCVSLSNMPNRFLHQTATSHPETIGSMYAADVVRRSCQYILLVREYVSSYTHAKIISNEKADTLRSSLIIACSEMRSRYGPQSTVRVDPASACRSLEGDPVLQTNNIKLELGREKFINKNPVAERAIRELHGEINRVSKDGGSITPATLALAVANLNTRIRTGGLSALEVHTQRDQFTGEQIPLEDRKIIQQKEEDRVKAHTPSAVYKSRGKTSPVFPVVKAGDIIYINSDRLKTRARERYIVVTAEPTTCKVQKFAGSQLRARCYTVNLADVTVVPPWTFSEEITAVSDDDDEIPEIPGIQADAQDHSVTQDVVDVSPEVSDAEDIPVQREPSPQIPRRSGRRTKRPGHLEDYVCDDSE